MRVLDGRPACARVETWRGSTVLMWYEAEKFVLRNAAQHTFIGAVQLIKRCKAQAGMKLRRQCRFGSLKCSSSCAQSPWDRVDVAADNAQPSRVNRRGWWSRAVVLFAIRNKRKYVSAGCFGSVRSCQVVKSSRFVGREACRISACLRRLDSYLCSQQVSIDGCKVRRRYGERMPDVPSCSSGEHAMQHREGGSSECK